ncbi:MAG: flagellar basal body L-ring protein FlgH [Emcibacter sp.]|nr:flagellar basal body L-ring protein FlgH [Emcibacter sp.]
MTYTLKKIDLPKFNRTSYRTFFLAVLLTLTLPGCSTVNRIGNIGKAPELAPIESTRVIPQQVAPLDRVIPVQAPQPPLLLNKGNSLWRIGSKNFFKDQRASKVGDILTINIIIDDKASINNQTTRTRTNSDSANAASFLGLETQLGKILPNAIDPSSLIDMGSSSSNVGSGKVNRSESVDLTLAAVVTQVLPNGNMVIQGRQEVRVNFEVRELTVMGVIRPEDISSANTIQHTQIAEARISYGGRGQLTDVQQARYGSQLFDILFPF